MEEEVLYLESHFSFENDKRLVRSRVKTITDKINKELDCIINYSLVDNIFKIIIESKSILSTSPTVIELANRLSQHKIELSDLRFFERKMVLISLYLQFESFCNNILLLGAFYYPEKFKSITSNFFKGKNLERLEASILNKDDRGFFASVNKYLKNHTTTSDFEKLMKGLFGDEFKLDHITKQRLSDFKKVRNIIVHQNAEPVKKDFDTIKIEGVILKSSMHDNYRTITGKEPEGIPNVATFSLDLSNADFWEKVLRAVQELINRVGEIVIQTFG